MAMTFQKAEKRQAKLRLTFDGPAGAGKTFSSLVLVRELGGRTALIDSEHGSASKYADKFSFDTLALDDFSLDTYMAAIKAAKDAGYPNLIIDSLSHAWTGKGGALEEVDRTGGNNKFTNGWRGVTPKHNALVDAILAYPGHVVCTMRKKMEYVLETNAKGQQVPVKVGMAPVQREGMEYEFDVVADIDINGNLTIAKTRCSDLTAKRNQMKWDDIPEMGRLLKAWLTDGTAAPAPAPVGAQSAAVDKPVSTPSGPGGAPTNEREKQEVHLAECQSHADLKQWAGKIDELLKAGKLTQFDKDAMRPFFQRRLGELSAAGRAA